MSDAPSHPDLLRLAVRIASAHVSHNAVTPDGLPGIIRLVYAALSNATADVSAPVKLQPAVPMKKSIFPDYVICLEDGRKMKMLKRHLRTVHRLTPQEYRERWGLPDDYPMVAPNHTARRSAIAKKSGLGRKRAPAASKVPPATSSPAPIQRVPEGVRGGRAARKVTVA